MTLKSTLPFASLPFRASVLVKGGILTVVTLVIGLGACGIGMGEAVDGADQEAASVDSRWSEPWTITTYGVACPSKENQSSCLACYSSDTAFKKDTDLQGTGCCGGDKEPFTQGCVGYNGQNRPQGPTTALGTIAKGGVSVAAPDWVPFNLCVKIGNVSTGRGAINIGYRIVEDRGSAITGTHIDVYQGKCTSLMKSEGSLYNDLGTTVTPIPPGNPEYDEHCKPLIGDRSVVESRLDANATEQKAMAECLKRYACFAPFLWSKYRENPERYCVSKCSDATNDYVCEDPAAYANNKANLDKQWENKKTTTVCVADLAAVPISIQSVPDSENSPQGIWQIGPADSFKTDDGSIAKVEFTAMPSFFQGFGKEKPADLKDLLTSLRHQTISDAPFVFKGYVETNKFIEYEWEAWSKNPDKPSALGTGVFYAGAGNNKPFVFRSGTSTYQFGVENLSDVACFDVALDGWKTASGADGMFSSCQYEDASTKARVSDSAKEVTSGLAAGTLALEAKILTLGLRTFIFTGHASKDGSGPAQTLGTFSFSLRAEKLSLPTAFFP